MSERLILIVLIFVVFIKVCERLWNYFARPREDVYSDYRNTIDAGVRRFNRMYLFYRVFWVMAFLLCMIAEMALIFF